MGLVKAVFNLFALKMGRWNYRKKPRFLQLNSFAIFIICVFYVIFGGIYCPFYIYLHKYVYKYM